MKAVFVKSSSNVSECPQEKLHEYAFIGRSNVGKSSLINMLTDNNKLAKTSSTPGKTQLINHFLIDDSWFLVDLPGYGFAKLSKTQIEVLRKIINSYLLNRSNLINIFVLVDSRHSPQKIDIDFMSSLIESGLAFSIIFTKSDKLKQRELNKNISNYKAKLLEIWESLPPIFISSSFKKEGGEEILAYISDLNEKIKL